MGGSSLNPVKAVKKAAKQLKKIVKDPEGALKNLGREIDRAHYVPLNKTMDKFAEKFTPEMPDMTQPEAQKYIAPDAEALAMARRRRRRGGAPTIMTSGSDTLGG